MEQRPPARHRRPPQEPGPRLLPIAFGLAIVGFVAGAGGKILIEQLRHHARPQAPQATPSPDYARLDLHGAQAKLAPIPTPRGTWLIATTRPQTPPPASPRPLVSVVPTASVAPTASIAPTPVPTSPSMLVAPFARASRPHAAVHHAVEPLVITSPKSLPSTVPTPDATPIASAQEWTVRRYLASLMRGDEATAYSLLGTMPGNGRAQLSEEAFINTSARITSVSADAHGAPDTVHAEVETAGGAYFATYHLRKYDGRMIIVDHDYIKL